MRRELIGVVAAVAACGGSPSPPPVSTVSPAGSEGPPIANRAPPAPVAPAQPLAAGGPPPLLAWPVPAFTAAQRRDALACKVDELADKAGKPAGTGSAAVHAGGGGCKDAVRAATCAAATKGDKPAAACVDAYRAAVRANPALAFVGANTGAFFGSSALIAPPPVAAQPVTKVSMHYAWGGLGTAVKWDVEIADAATDHPRVTITGASQPATPPADLRAKVAAFGTSLDSLFPIGKPLNAVDCTDNYPDWTVDLQFADGGKLALATHGSNLLGLGGPWQTDVGGVTYLQLGPGVANAVFGVAHALALPFGQPEGEFCRGYDLATAVLAPPAAP